MDPICYLNSASLGPFRVFFGVHGAPLGSPEARYSTTMAKYLETCNQNYLKGVFFYRL